jgi:hypothetical protein
MVAMLSAAQAELLASGATKDPASRCQTSLQRIIPILKG